MLKTDKEDDDFVRTPVSYKGVGSFESQLHLVFNKSCASQPSSV